MGLSIRSARTTTKVEMRRIANAAICALRVSLGALFVYAGAVKLAGSSNFAQDVRSFQLVPPSFVKPIAFSLPWLEMALGALLIAKRLRYISVLGLLFLMSLFTGAITSAYCRGISITCGCFGSRVNQTSYKWLFTRDIVILVLLLIVALHELKPIKSPEAIQENPP